MPFARQLAKKCAVKGALFPQLGCRVSLFKAVTHLQGKFIFNEGRNFVLNYVSPLKIRCFFGLAAMPRGGVEGSFCQKTESNCKLPAAGPIRLCPRQGKVYLPVP